MGSEATTFSNTPWVSWVTRRARAEGPDAQRLRGRGGRRAAAVPGEGAGRGGGRLDRHRAGGVGHGDGEQPFSIAAPSPLPGILGRTQGTKTGKETTNEKHITGNRGTVLV